jgi:hypothetical protein
MRREEGDAQQTGNAKQGTDNLPRYSFQESVQRHEKFEARIASVLPKIQTEHLLYTNQKHQH